MLIGILERSARERVQVATESYKGKEYIDIRIYFTDDDGQTWKPTKKGVTVMPDQVETVIDLIGKAKENLGKSE